MGQFIRFSRSIARQLRLLDVGPRLWTTTFDFFKNRALAAIHTVVFGFTSLRDESFPASCSEPIRNLHRSLNSPVSPR